MCGEKEVIVTAEASELTFTSNKIVSLTWYFCVYMCMGMTSGCVDARSWDWVAFQSFSSFVSDLCSEHQESACLPSARITHMYQSALLLTWVIRTRIRVLVPYRLSYLPLPLKLSFDLCLDLIASVCLASEVLKKMVFSYCQYFFFTQSSTDTTLTFAESVLWLYPPYDGHFCIGWIFYGFWSKRSLWHSEFLCRIICWRCTGMSDLPLELLLFCMSLAYLFL